MIPVLLKNAALPAVPDLPHDLAPLAMHQAITLRDESWSEDVGRLIGAIGPPYRWRVVALRAVIALVAIVVAVKLLLPWLPEDRANDVVFLRTLIGSIVGIYALAEIAAAYRHFRNLQRKYRSDSSA